MLKKIFIGIIVFFVLLITAIIVVPIVFKDKIIAKVKTEINNNINAKVDFGDFSITIIRSFPNLSFSLEDLRVIGIDEFKNDTLTSIKSLDITVDIMSVIKQEKIKIRKISLDNPRIHAIVTKEGKANWDITKPSADTSKGEDGEGTEFKVALKKFEINNGFILYEDAKAGTVASIVNLNHTLTGDFTQDIFDLETKTTADEVNVLFGGIKYLNKVKTDIKIDMMADMPNSKYTFKENELQLNELILGFDGFVSMPEKNTVMDIKFHAKKTDFKNILSLVPAIYTKDFKDLKSSGTLALDGFAKGTYNETSLPAFALNLQINNGHFQYPSLPTPVNNVLVDLKVTNPDGVVDHTVIDLKKMHIEIGTEPFDARLLVKTPKSDAQIDVAIKGRVNLANIQNIVPLEKGTTLAGLITADVTANGRMSQIEQKKYEDFKAAGQISGSNIKYNSPTVPKPIDLSKLEMKFNPQNVTLSAFDMKLGKSDIHMTGTLDNFIAYAIKNETLKGTINMNSSLIDLTELSGNNEPKKESAPAGESAPMKVVEVPVNVDFTMNTTITKLLYDNMVLSNFKGSLIVKEQTVNMSNISFQMLDGSVIMNGAYNTKDIKKPGVDFDLAVTDFDIQQTVKTFNTVKKMAPIAERASGKFSSKFKFNGTLDGKMQPVMNSLNGGGNLSTKQVTIENFPPLVKVADAIKMEKYKKLDLNNINLTFKFKDGRVFVDPFDMKAGNIKAKVFGSNGFDQTIDYTMSFEIPRAEFGGAANSALESLVGLVNKQGANVSLGANINMDALIGGTVNKPTVKVAMKGSSGKSGGEDLKAKAKEEFDKKKAELEAKAKAEADKYKQEAENKAKETANKAKSEAEAKAKAEADRLKKEAEEKAKNAAKDKLKGLFPR